MKKSVAQKSSTAGSARAKRAVPKTAKTEGAASGSAAALIDARIRELADWRGKLLAEVRSIIRRTDPEIVEEWKWRGVPVWSHGGIVCTGETYKSVVKLTFAQGASLPDPSGLFNSSLEGKVRRAIDLHEGALVDADALRELILAAIALNLNKAKRPRTAE